MRKPWPAARPEPFFTDVSDRLEHAHFDGPFGDFKRQSLLPNRLSHLGPGVCWADLDRDGDDDLLVGGGRGGELSRFENVGEGGFRRMPSLAAIEDHATILNTVDGRGESMILLGLQNYEVNTNGAPSFHMINVATGGGSATRQSILKDSATGPMSLADVDGDGGVKVFL